MLDQKSNFKLVLLSFLMIAIFACKDKKEAKAIYDVATAQDPLTQSIDRGAEVYQNFCTQCHRPNGKGIGKTFPPLDGSNWLTEKRTESIHALKYGLNGEIQVNGVTYNSAMAAQGLNDQEVADVMNYIMNSWSNTQDEIVTVEEVKKVLKE